VGPLELPADYYTTRKEWELASRLHLREHELHSEAHDREHELATVALDKAAGDLSRRLDEMNQFREQLRDQASTFMTTTRFEREHAALVNRIDEAIERLTARLDAESTVTTRQDAQAALLEKLAGNNRWLIATALSSGLALIALILHLAKIY
jgi:cell division protein ZapA (FtsZ GTPase activity inhibitor)